MTKLWTVLCGAVASVVLALLTLLRIRTKQRDNAKAEEKRTQANLNTVVKVKEQQTEIQKAVEEVRQTAREVENENFKNRNTPPSGNFGDKRLRRNKD